MNKQKAFWLKAIAASSLLTIGIFLGNTSLGEIACASAQVAGLPEAYCNCQKNYSGVVTVKYNNGTSHSNIHRVQFPAPCPNPRVFVQSHSDSLKCGSTIGPGNCLNNPATASTDIHAQIVNVSPAGFETFISAMDNIWVGPVSPNLRISYNAICGS